MYKESVIHYKKINCEFLKMDYGFLKIDYGFLKMDYGLLKWIKDIAKNKFEVLRSKKIMCSQYLEINFWQEIPNLLLRIRNPLLGICNPLLLIRMSGKRSSGQRFLFHHFSDNRTKSSRTPPLG